MSIHALRSFLEYQAYQLRVLSLQMTSRAGSGHPTSCLSAADLVAGLFFYGMHQDPNDFNSPFNDRFILSKGHAAPLLYASWHLLGKVSFDELMSYRQVDSAIEGHPTRRFAYAQAATGSLGMGLSIGAGMGLYNHMHDLRAKTFVLLGDSEVAEGSIWEAAEIASFYNLNNLIGILDVNRLGQTDQTILGWNVTKYQDRFEAFGWHTITINGHDMQEIMDAYDAARAITGKPVMIIAKTIKGTGLASIENKSDFHGKAFSAQQLPPLLKELHERYVQAASYPTHAQKYEPALPVKTPIKELVLPTVKRPTYAKDIPVATRKAYGQAIAYLAGQDEKIVALDAEVKNSTFAELFEDVAPQRFVQCFIAEQNMVSMGVGFDSLGAVPFISTFGAFFTRAFDQLRMAAIGQAALRLAGSHAGVSIGQDGPSQMALEDMAMISSLPASIILYPADAVATLALVERMHEYKDGISYLRTTRSATPILYDADTPFTIGGCHVLRSSDQDQVCIVAAGITLFQALKAYQELKDEGISCAVIDAYSIKPLDHQTILKVAQASGKKIISVEDHYSQGGLGASIAAALINSDIRLTILAVHERMRSGTPEDLMALARIDTAAIKQAVRFVQ